MRIRPHEAILLGGLAVTAWLIVPGHGNPFLAKQPLALAAMWTAIAGMFLSRRGSDGGAFTVAALALLAAGAASVVGASNRGAAFASVLVLGGCTLLAGAIASGRASPRFARAFFLALVVVAIPVATLAVAQRVVDLDFGLQALGKMRAFSSLGNPNFVAFSLLVPLAIAVAARRGAIAGLLFAGLVATSSRSAALALLVAGSAWMVARPVRGGVARAAAAMLAVAAIGAVVVGTATHGGRGRLLLWREAIEIARTHPLAGVGLANYDVHQLAAQRAVFATGRWEGFVENASFVLDAHDTPLHLLAEAGPIAPVAFLACAAIALVRGRRRARRSRVWRAAWAGFAGQLAFLLWNAPLAYAPVALPFWITAGLLAAPASRAPRRRVLLVPVFALAVAALAASAVPDVWRAGALDGRGSGLLETGPFADSTAAFRDAVRLQPHDGYLREKLALSLYFEGRHADALDELARARPLFGDVGILYLRAEILARGGRDAEALDAYREIAASFPQHVTPHFMAGQIHLERREWAMARFELERAVAAPESKKNLKLDREKVRRQKELAAEMLRRPELRPWLE